MPRIHVNGADLNYRFDGPAEGPVIMLSTSLSADLAMWANQVPALVAAGYRVLRYDTRGLGHSAVTDGAYSIEMLTEDVLGLMDALDLEQVHFCGLSMGGMIGQKLGSLHGERLLSLTLSSTASHMPPPESWDERIETVRENGMGFVVDATIDRWFTKAGQERLPEEVKKVRSMILNTQVDGYCACCGAIRDMDQRESIRGISTRTLVIVGEHDPGTPVSAARFIHERIPSSELKIIPDAAHFVNVERADVFNNVLLKFMGQLKT